MLLVPAPGHNCIQTTVFFYNCYG
uniref:Uncharacterized protein n=1 Tax=Arundo donax TaxID=35708 RepID=A0A0A9GWQ2_ARUDO